MRSSVQIATLVFRQVDSMPIMYRNNGGFFSRAYTHAIDLPKRLLLMPWGINNWNYKIKRIVSRIGAAEDVLGMNKGREKLVAGSEKIVLDRAEQ